MSNLTFTWTQDMPRARHLAADVARSDVGVAEQALAATRLRVRAAVKDAYAELYRVERTTAILEESRALLEGFKDAARARHETGQGILENVLKAQTELTRVDVELAGLAQERRGAQVALAAGAGVTPEFGAARVPLEGRTPEAIAVERAAVERSPELAAIRAGVERDRKRVEVARKNLSADWMWSAGYANRGSLDPMVMGMLGFKLPVWRSGKKAAVARSESELEATEKDVDARTLSLLAEVRDLLARAERADAQARLIREGTLPLSRSTLDAAAAAYAAGRAEFMTLLEDFRALLGYEVELEAREAERVRALAALEPLTGAEYVLPGEAGGAHE
jgi:outer membrane protein TolC